MYKPAPVQAGIIQPRADLDPATYFTFYNERKRARMLPLGILLGSSSIRDASLQPLEQNVRLCSTGRLRRSYRKSPAWIISSVNTTVLPTCAPGSLSGQHAVARVDQIAGLSQLRCHAHQTFRHMPGRASVSWRCPFSVAAPITRSFRMRPSTIGPQTASSLATSPDGAGEIRPKLESTVSLCT